MACLSKIILNCPDEVLNKCLDEITDKIIALLKVRNFHSKQELLECLIQIIFHIKDDFRSHCGKFIFYLIETIKSIDHKTLDYKRVAIDAIYSIAVHCQAEIVNHVPEILKLLDIARTNKN